MIKTLVVIKITKKETVYSTNLKNEKSRSIAQNQGIDVSYVKLMFRGLMNLVN